SAVKLEVAWAVHAHEEGLVLGGDLVPVVGDVLEGERAAVGQAPGAGARGGEDARDVVAGLLHDQLRPDVHRGQRAPAVVDLLHVDRVVHVHELQQVEQEQRHVGVGAGGDVRHRGGPGNPGVQLAQVDRAGVGVG